ncbi:sensory neuron membrane protein 2-like [Cimex lectularius]|uniref:Sensory neuron membrane protein n=1 Tax=Cimex lectularius TaxID=79782 RepID=A0A8I6RY92_CIMLE|nr:sensory neuron membrane protein 2-like [Cimex lectularius]XP_024085831.1 sensory neuron membrane protein 2-like [Cimex lectularius]
MGALTVKRILYVAAFGAFFVILGGYFGWYGFEYITMRKIHKDLSLDNDTKGFTNWKNLPVLIKFSMYLFNVTNPEEIQLGGKPILQETGPYVFEIQKSRTNISWWPDGTIQYYDKSIYRYAQDTDVQNSLDEEITLLNVGLLGAAILVERIFPFGLSLVNEAIPLLFPNSTDMFIRATVREILFDGVMIQCNYTSGSAMPICNGLKAKAPPTIIRDEVTKHYSFAMLRHKNNTLSGPYRVNTGSKNVSELGKIVEVKNKMYIPFWDKNTTCSEIKGTDSTIFPPLTEPKNDIYIYVPDVCISMSASFVNKSYLDSKITAYHYESSKNNFASVEEWPENKCKCSKLEDSHKEPFCYKRGAFEAFDCQGSPIVFSPPHFLDADPSYLNYVEGLKPDREKHLTYVSIEPLTGVPISGRKRIQMNMFLKKIKGITLLTNVTEGLFPIGWAEEGADLHSGGITELAKLYYLLETFKVIRWILIILGVILMVIALLLYLKMKHLLCFHNNQVTAEFEYGVNQWRAKEGEPQKLSTFNTDKVSGVEDAPQTISTIYPPLGNKGDVPTSITSTTVPR